MIESALAAVCVGGEALVAERTAAFDVSSSD
jgi:hypothetical protein